MNMIAILDGNTFNNSRTRLQLERGYCGTATHPAVYHAPARNEAKEGLGLLDARLPHTGDQTMQPAEPYFHATSHVQRVKAGARLR